MSGRTMKVKIIGDSRNVEKMFGSVGSAGASMGARLSGGLRSAVTGFAKLTAGAALLGTALLGGAVKGAFSLANNAADLGEAQSKANAVLGDGAVAVESFADSAAGSFGLSKRAATDFSSSFATLLKPSAESTDQLADMSTTLTGLTGDLASFHNLAGEDVAGKIFAGLSGEAEPLKALGVFITAAAVDAKALELGLGDATGAVSEAAKVQARYALIMDQTSDAHGDFAKTVKGMPNAQRRLGAVWENVRATLGEKLAPAFADVLTRFADVLPGLLDAALPVFEKVAGFVGSVIGEIGGAVIAFANALRFADGEVTSNGLPGFAERLGGMIATKLVPAIKSAVGWVVDNWPKISAVVGTVMSAVGTGIGFVVDEVLPRIVAAGKLAVGWVVDNWPKISETIGNVLTRAGEIVGGFVDVVTAFWGRFGDTILTTLRGTWDLVSDVIGKATGIVVGILDTFAALFRGDWSALWDGVKGVLSDAVGLIGTIVSGGFSLIWSTLDGILGSMLNGAGEKVQGLLGYFVSLPGKILDALAGAAGWLVGKGGDLVSGLWDGAKSVFRSVVAWVGSVPGLIVSAVGGVVGTLWAKGRDVITGLWNGVKSLFSGSGGSAQPGTFLGWFGGLPGMILGAVGSLAYTLWSAGSDVVQGLWDGARDKLTGFASWLSGEVSSALGWAKDLIMGTDLSVYATVGRSADGTSTSSRRPDTREPEPGAWSVAPGGSNDAAGGNGSFQVIIANPSPAATARALDGAYGFGFGSGPSIGGLF